MARPRTQRFLVGAGVCGVGFGDDVVAGELALLQVRTQRVEAHHHRLAAVAGAAQVGRAELGHVQRRVGRRLARPLRRRALLPGSARARGRRDAPGWPST